jgi:hypothetical protein
MTGTGSEAGELGFALGTPCTDRLRWWSGGFVELRNNRRSFARLTRTLVKLLASDAFVLTETGVSGECRDFLDPSCEDDDDCWMMASTIGLVIAGKGMLVPAESNA